LFVQKNKRYRHYVTNKYYKLELNTPQLTQ
jgi:hypothetical protein